MKLRPIYLIIFSIALVVIVVIITGFYISKPAVLDTIENVAPQAVIIDSAPQEKTVLQQKVEKTYQSLALEQQLGQLFMPAVGKNGLPFETVRMWAEDGIIPGFMVLGTDITDDQIQELRNLIQQSTGIPPLVAIDAEPSLVQYRIPGYQFLNTNQYDTVESSADVASEISDILISKGYNVNFAPVYDTNANDSVIGSRSYGSTPEQTALLANAFVTSSTMRGIATTAKHFPGHGQVSGDSHLMLPTINGELTELPAFISAIENDVPLIMIGHLAVSDNQMWSTDGLPSTLSPLIMKDLLRDKLGFMGVVITDAFNMSALDAFQNKEIESIKAGADIVLMPEVNIMLLIDLMYEEIQIDPTLEQEVEQKIKRILEIRHTLR
jgi:beta-N-acetylhexosaminidase